ncbi:MAG: M14 family metallopeptidase, partial [bacterium]|nr:M14 family metallopeptidase [bacterium]
MTHANATGGVASSVDEWVQHFFISAFLLASCVGYFIDTHDRRVLREYEIGSATDEVLQYLTSEEIRYEFASPSNWGDHNSTIRLIATDQFIYGIEQRFRVSARLKVAPQIDRVLRQPIGSQCNGFVPDISNSDYLWSYGDIENLLASTAIQSAGQVANLGASFEGRSIWGVKFGPLDGNLGAPTVYIVATQHAREWAAAGTAVGLIKKLAEVVLDQTHTIRPELREALEHAAVVIVPVANPDGYEHTRTVDRMWRGNRNLTDCYISGVNLNRNHRATWSVPANQTNPDCYSPVAQPTDYIGPAAVSENETRAIERLLHGDGFETQGRGILVLDYHTYSDLVVYPSGYKQHKDVIGPACANYLDSNCHTADLSALRELLGDTTSHRFVPPLFVGERPPDRGRASVDVGVAVVQRGGRARAQAAGMSAGMSLSRTRRERRG